jgi:hypothetical protein
LASTFCGSAAYLAPEMLRMRATITHWTSMVWECFCLRCWLAQRLTMPQGARSSS